jgi:hypothetical protein
LGERHSEYSRDGDDWYVEPEWCVRALYERVPFVGGTHDPCCGMGTIPKFLGGTGSDLVDRGYGYPRRDFLQDMARYDNIVTNPPYGRAQEIIEHALSTTKYRVAALVQVKFLASQRRHKLFTRDETEKVIMFSRRPSMPPGKLLEEQGESIRGNGSLDFCWVVWCRGNLAATVIDWAK